MTEILFYHLERARLEDVLPGLLEKSLARGWRACVRAGGRERVEALDQFLWTYRDESFLPHSASGEGADQPIWLTEKDEAPNAPQILFLVDGAPTDDLSVDGLERCVLIFDGRDEDALGDARKAWKRFKEQDLDATYWRQSDQGRWEKQ